jgi:PncC family amidohydrolase
MGMELNLNEPLESKIGPLLRARNLRLVLAESCTGGMIGNRITNIPGSSDYYLGSITAYAYEAKEKILGVNHEALMKFGAVSREIALEMARGARNALAGSFPLENLIGISVTGIAGPGGGMPHKPVGLVYIGMSAQGGDWVWKYLWRGDRVENKVSSADAALTLLLDYLEGHLPLETS